MAFGVVCNLVKLHMVNFYYSFNPCAAAVQDITFNRVHLARKVVFQQ